MVMSILRKVVLICHEYEQTDDGGNVIGIQPLLTVRVVKPSRSGSVRVYYLGRCERNGLEDEMHNSCWMIHLVGSRTGVADNIQWTFRRLRQG